MKYDYDIIVIGGGAAGMTAAKTAHGMGKKVLLIEKSKLGGECTWTGCIPSKTMIQSARIAHIIKNATQWGIHSELPSQNSTSVMQYIQRVIEDIYATHSPEVMHEHGIATLFGAPTFIDPYTILVNEASIRAKKYIIATGSSPFIPPIEGLENTPYYTNETFFSQKKLPKKLIIIGGGPIGVELAGACNRLGVQTTIIEMNSRILMQEDAQMVDLVQNQFIKEGVIVLTECHVVKVTHENKEITVTYVDKDNNTQQVHTDALLIATGRRANTHGLGLEKIGIVVEKGAIKTNQRMQTSLKHIYACGDVVGPYLFSHMAWYQAAAAARNACIPLFKKKIDPNMRIWATFSSPEYARIGLTEQEAKSHYGDTLWVYTRSYDTLDRAHTDNATYGMAKIICDKKKRILGAHIVGQHAADIIHELFILKQHNIPFDNLHSIVHIYPTYAELLWHMSKKSYIDTIKNKLIIRIFRKIFRT